MNGDGTVLVTGGSGFLGGWCIVEALRAGHRVRTTVRSTSREPEVRANIATSLDAGDRLEVVRADLTSDEGWPEAVGGCEYVLHVASPFPEKQPKDPDELIVPAREGALRVLRASLDAGVKRIVMTSSVAAVRNGSDGALEGRRELTEEDWSDPADPHMTPVRAVEEHRRAGGVGADARTRRRGSPRDDPARGDRRTGAGRGPLLLAGGDRAPARGAHARTAAARLRVRGRT